MKIVSIHPVMKKKSDFDDFQKNALRNRSNQDEWEKVLYHDCLYKKITVERNTQRRIFKKVAPTEENGHTMSERDFYKIFEEWKWCNEFDNISSWVVSRTIDEQKEDQLPESYFKREALYLCHPDGADL